MASSTNKKVQVYRFDRESLPGFVNPATFLVENGVELLHLNGTVGVIPFNDIKIVLFVREFGGTGIPNERRTFLSRPKSDGIWLRLTFRDGDTLESVVPNNLLQIGTEGFHVIPPDSTQRAFVPRVALTDVQVLGVVGSPLRKGKQKPAAKEQIGLFEGPQA